MLSEEERRSLSSRLADSMAPLAAVLKCVAGLLALFLVAAGPWTVLTAGGPSSAGAERPAPQVDQAVAESRRVFDERRHAYAPAPQIHSADPSNPAATPRLAVD